jgi:MFS superfamily sulfate permease-like transporter
VAVIGEIPSGLPGVALPDTPLADVVHLIPAALGIFLVGYADGILTARAFAGRHHQNIRPSQELLSFSAANAAAGITQGFPVGASTSRTAVNDQMGVRTQFAGAVAAGAIAIVLIALTDPMSYLPKAVLGAVIVSAAVGLVEPRAWRDLARASRFEVGIAAATTVGVVAVGVLPSLLLAVALSVADAIRRSARPHDAVLGWVPELGRWGNVAVNPSAQLTPGVVVYRLDDRLFFANANFFKGRVREAVRGAPYDVHCVVFDAEAVGHADATGQEALADIARDLQRREVALLVARMHPHVQRHLRDSGVEDVVGADNFYPTVRSAVAAWVNRRDPAES